MIFLLKKVHWDKFFLHFKRFSETGGKSETGIMHHWLCGWTPLPPNILEKSMPVLVLLLTGYCDAPQFLLHFKISFSDFSVQM